MYTILCLGLNATSFDKISIPLLPGCRCLQADNSTDALEYCSEQKPDILLGSVSDTQDELLKLTVKLHILNWFIPTIALCEQNIQSDNAKALIRLGAAVIAAPEGSHERHLTQLISDYLALT